MLRDEMDRLRRRAQSCARVVLATVLVTGNRCNLPSEWQGRDPRHRILVDCIRRLPEDVEANLLNVYAALASAGSLSDAGGITYLLEVTSTDTAPASAVLLAQLAEESTEHWERYARANELLKEAEATIRGGMSEHRLLHPLDEIELTPAVWLVKGLLEAETLSSFFGPPASAKTFVAVSLAACVASGSDFHGYPVKQSGPVILIAGEGNRGLRRRFRAWENDQGIDLGDRSVYISERPVLFGSADAVAPLYHELRDISERIGAPALVVVDTLSRNLEGDENSSGDMPRFVQAVTDLRNTFRCSVVVIHHSGHSNADRSRGHSAFRAALDHEYRVEREDRTVRLMCTKSKESTPAEPLQFEMRTVELGITDEDGWPVASAVLDRSEYEMPAAEKPKKGGRNKAKALDVLTALYREHAERVARAGCDAEDTQVLVNDWKAECERRADMDRKRFSEAKKALIRDGRVTVVGEYARLASYPDDSASSGLAVRPCVRPSPLKGGSDRTDTDTGPLSDKQSIFGRFSDRPWTLRQSRFGFGCLLILAALQAPRHRKRSSRPNG